MSMAVFYYYFRKENFGEESFKPSFSELNWSSKYKLCAIYIMRTNFRVR